MINCEMPTRASSHSDLHEGYIWPVNGCRDIRKSHGDSHTVDTSSDTVSNPSDCNTGCHAICAINPSPRNVHSFTAKNVEFSSWNICGLYDHKVCDDMLGSSLKHHDVISITETWACDTDNFRLEGYVYHNFSRKIKHPNAKQNSGGIGILIRKEMVEGI